MTLKERVIPWKLQQLRAIERRMPTVPAKLKEDLNLYESGYRGEQNLDYHLSFLQGEDFEVLHDLRLRGENGFYFQIDCLVVTQHVLVIVEVKNMVGRFQFRDESGQMVRVWRGEEVVMPNPLNQIWRQQSQLSGWLVARRFPLIPIESLVVFSNPSTIIQSTEEGKQSLSRVIHAEGIVTRLEKISKKFSHNGRKQLLPSTCRKLSEKLVQSHTPLYSSILELYNLHPQNLIKGVFCSQCNKPHMIRQSKSGRWTCKHCNKNSKTAYVQALEDYYLLIKPTISNQELRDYLQIDSSAVAYQLLRKLDVKRTHKNKHCYYHLTIPLRLK
ncbi:nuclease-related domain-containing protein [Alkalicoccobacillus gibsonii]|uniref:Nuclease-related domain-containing protein n=1 Tax=Alkalicoccobacillus gibsonii TaxID=79881 RepID=A0ABU9VM55_9BACI